MLRRWFGMSLVVVVVAGAVSAVERPKRGIVDWFLGRLKADIELV